jgi:hypothetical protein
MSTGGRSSCAARVGTMIRRAMVLRRRGTAPSAASRLAAPDVAGIRVTTDGTPADGFFLDGGNGTAFDFDPIRTGTTFAAVAPASAAAVPSRRPGWLLAMGLASLMAWRAVRSWTASHPAHQARRRTAVSQRWRERKRPDGADHPLGLSSHRHRRQVMNRVSSSRLSPPYGCRVRTLAVTSDRRAEGPPGARQANLPGKRMLAQSNNLGARGAQGGIWSESHFAVSFRLIERMSDARAGQ